MSKILIDEALVRQALDDLEKLAVTVDWEWGSCRSLAEIEADGDLSPVVIDLRQTLADAALDKMKENARELGLDYMEGSAEQYEKEQPAQQDISWCMKMNGCKTKCEDCPDEVPKQPVPAQPLTRAENRTWWASEVRAFEAKHNITKGGA